MINPTANDLLARYICNVASSGYAPFESLPHKEQDRFRQIAQAITMFVERAQVQPIVAEPAKTISEPAKRVPEADEYEESAKTAHLASHCALESRIHDLEVLVDSQVGYLDYIRECLCLT